MGLAAAVRYLEALGMANIAAHERDLTADALDPPGRDSTVACASSDRPTRTDRGGVISLDVEGVHPHDVAQVLDQFGVCVRPGPPLRQAPHAPLRRLAATARASFGPYSLREDTDVLLEALGHAVKMFGWPMANLDDLYREIILDHYRSPRNRGELGAPAHRVEGFNPLCGDEIVVYLDVDDGVLKDIKMTGHGCSISQSSASLMSAAVKGKSLDQVRETIATFKALMTVHEAQLDDGDADEPGTSTCARSANWPPCRAW